MTKDQEIAGVEDAPVHQAELMAPGAYQGEDAPEPTFEPRRAAKGQTFGYTDAEGSQREISADAKGLIHPSNIAEVRLLDSFDLPVARVKDDAKDEAKPVEITAGPKAENTAAVAEKEA